MMGKVEGGGVHFVSRIRASFETAGDVGWSVILAGQ